MKTIRWEAKYFVPTILKKPLSKSSNLCLVFLIISIRSLQKRDTEFYHGAQDFLCLLNHQAYFLHSSSKSKHLHFVYVMRYRKDVLKANNFSIKYTSSWVLFGAFLISSLCNRCICVNALHLLLSSMVNWLFHFSYVFFKIKFGK